MTIKDIAALLHLGTARNASVRLQEWAKDHAGKKKQDSAYDTEYHHVLVSGGAYRDGNVLKFFWQGHGNLGFNRREQKNRRKERGSFHHGVHGI